MGVDQAVIRITTSSRLDLIFKRNISQKNGENIHVREELFILCFTYILIEDFNHASRYHKRRFYRNDAHYLSIMAAFAR